MKALKKKRLILLDQGHLPELTDKVQNMHLMQELIKILRTTP